MRATINLEKEKHFPVLIDELVSIISPLYGGTFIDCTFGQGSCSKKILEYKNNKIIALDRDTDTFNNANWFKKKYKDRFYFENIKFSEIDKIKINLENLTKLLPYLPAVSVAFYIIFNPMTLGQHDQMVEFLANNFNEKCYMSCDLLKSKSTIFQQFQVNFSKYSFEVFLRYFLIIIIGFGPLFILLFYSKLKDKNLIFFKNFNNLLIPFLFILSPVLVLFAMGYDWGRWVNIGYVFSIISYVYLYKKRKIFISENKIQNNKLNKVSKKIFVLFFVIYCFGWNPKTVITGDVASFPGYRIPYKVFKLLNQQ